MNMLQCPNGHFYDRDKYPQGCPYCSTASDGTNRTVPLSDETYGAYTADDSSIPPTSHEAEDIGKTVPLSPFGEPQVERTVAVIDKKMGMEPVVGWLVCTKGASRGRDFHIYDGNNSVGRDPSMRICVPGDSTISSMDMAFITYDAMSKKFYVIAGKGMNLVRFNDELLPVSQSRELHGYDRIMLGETELTFIPFCGEAFGWA